MVESSFKMLLVGCDLTEGKMAVGLLFIAAAPFNELAKQGRRRVHLLYPSVETDDK
jgi:hypothetical protein